MVGGDVVPGPFNRDVLDRLAGDDVAVHWVRGNGEREVAEAVAARRPLSDFAAEVGAHGASWAPRGRASWASSR